MKVAKLTYLNEKIAAWPLFDEKVASSLFLNRKVSVDLNKKVASYTISYDSRKVGNFEGESNKLAFFE